MKKLIYLTFLIASIMLSGTACTKKNLETTYARQEENIDNFLKQKLKIVQQENPDAEIIHYKGSNRLTLKQGTGEPASANSIVTITYAAYIFQTGISNSNLIGTNSEDIAVNANWVTTDMNFEPVTLNLGKDRLIEGLKNGLVGIKSGEECYIVFSGKYGYGKKKHGNIPANSALLYHIWAH